MDAAGEDIPITDLNRLHEVLDDLRKWKSKTPLGKCLYWREECNRPIGSHSLSECWLRHLATENHVITFRLAAEKAGKEPVTVVAERKGVNQASVFRGFCPMHDNALFAGIDTLHVRPTPENCLALAYRSTCQCACAKFHIVGASLSQPQFLRSPYPHPFELHVVREMKATIDLLARKQTIEQRLDRQPRAGFCHQFIELRGFVSFAAAATFLPVVTATGKKLEQRNDWITLTVLPSTGGGTAVLSWERTRSKNANLLIKSITRISSQKVLDFLFFFTLEHMENFVLAPAWWDSLSSGRRMRIKQCFARSIGNPVPPGVLFALKGPAMLPCSNVTFREIT